MTCGLVRGFGFFGCFVVVCIWFHSRSCSVWLGFGGVGLVFPGFPVLVWVGVICSCGLPTLCWCSCFAGGLGVGF